jgi:hypothetical protein
MEHQIGQALCHGLANLSNTVLIVDNRTLIKDIIAVIVEEDY